MGQAKSKSWRRLSESDLSDHVHLLIDEHATAAAATTGGGGAIHTKDRKNETRPDSGAGFRTPALDDHLVDYAFRSNDNEMRLTPNEKRNMCKLFRVGPMCKASRTAAPGVTLRPPPTYDETFAIAPNTNTTTVSDALRRSLQTQSTIFPLPTPTTSTTTNEMTSRAEVEDIYSLETNEMGNVKPLIDFNANNFLLASPPPPPPPSIDNNRRPMSMFQFEPSKALLSTNEVVAHHHLHHQQHRHSQMLPLLASPPPVPPTSSVVDEHRRHRLSLSEMLECFNSFEECADFSDQSTPEVPTSPLNERGKLLNLADVEEESETSDSNNNNNNSNTNNNHPVLETTKESRKCSGLECQCKRCFANRYKLLNWLLPNCTRINAERLLYGRKEGTFLVRKSEKFPGQYTLSFVCRRVVRHCLIMRSVYGFGLRWPYSFETLQQVIAHYAHHSLIEFNSKLDVRLLFPVFMS